MTALIFSSALGELEGQEKGQRGFRKAPLATMPRKKAVISSKSIVATRWPQGQGGKKPLCQILKR